MPFGPLCQHCCKLEIDCNRPLDIPAIKIDLYDRHPELPALTNSAEQGCEVCKLFLEEIRRRFRRQPPRLKSGQSTWDGSFVIKDLAIVLENDSLTKDDHVGETVNGPHRLLLSLESPQFHLYRIPFDIFAEKDSAVWGGKIQRRLPQFDASSDASIELIQTWLRECDQQHKDCRRSKPSNLPTRVVDVSHEMPRLVIADKDITGEYLALSHCWGDPKTSKPPLKTQINSLESRLRGIDMRELPRNFQDAIIITRKLGLQYVWIDSLCIIQDSPADWTAEAAKMGDVYMNSYLTVAATSAISSHDGFLNQSRKQQIVKVPCHQMNRADPAYFYLRTTDKHWLENSFDKHLEGSVWNSRGWTFQERLLPMRVLHFAQDMFYLECHSRDRAEDNRPAFIRGNRTPWLQTNGRQLAGQSEALPSSPTPSKKDHIYRSWYNIVEHYVLRDFTYAKDKLPAIAGLAQEMAEMIEDVYMAGLWEKDLCRGLMWYTVSDYEIITLQRNRAPSWSWACLDARIVWFGVDTTPLEMYAGQFTLLSHTTDMATPGDVTTVRGQINVSGKLIEVSAILQEQMPAATRWSTHDIVVRDTNIGEGRLDLKDDSTVKPGLSAFLVYYDISEPNRKQYASRPMGLLLETIQTCSNEYRRVGVFELQRRYFEDSTKLDTSSVFDEYPTQIFTLV